MTTDDKCDLLQLPYITFVKFTSGHVLPRMKDLVHELPFDPLFNNYLICGHTHRRVIGEVVPGFMGVNVGSDYDDLKTFTLEV